ncbi:hypothetical protein GRI97_05525 [Altererythrobacter xixiisoli]|uniref:HTH luxR-type domain-containing protein n=1 Tax=Croceibacterium xixiisoli TaxID=1476466 RepID=A0A6I4TQK5_9SPHN|nr:LuxR C-terminal-related transcriptional regulator [Croceibacterium xixiisoli]MXO98445.1 hypothetical protein [Croceibacterium xixiisoli]
MASGAQIHIIDEDFRRRAEIANRAKSQAFHAEIYESCAEFVRYAPKTGVVLAHDDPEVLDGADLVSAIMGDGRHLPVALYSVDPTPDMIVKAMLAGALSYLRWPFTDDAFAKTFARFTTEGVARMKRESRYAEARKLVERLTDRERAVLMEILHSNSNKEAGQKLGISYRTVEIHRANLMRKLNARSTPEAVRIAIYGGLDEDF